MTAKFSASNADRLMACDASANLELAIPNWTMPPRRVGGRADEGTSLHEMMAEMWKLPPRELVNVTKCLDYVATLRQSRRFKVLVEEELTAEWLAQKPTTTVDLGLYVQDELHVIDTKTGKIPVPAVHNRQLLFYARCLITLAPKAKGVHLHILQPWADNMDHWFVTTDELAAFTAEAQAAEQRHLAHSLTFNITDKGCLFCPANPHGRGAKGGPYCPAKMQELYPTTAVDESAMLEDI